MVHHDSCKICNLRFGRLMSSMQAFMILDDLGPRTTTKWFAMVSQKKKSLLKKQRL